MKTTRLAVATALFVLLATANASAFWYSAMSENDSVKGATETKVFTHKLAEQAEGTELELSLRLKQGQAVVTLIDPTGAARYRQTFNAGRSHVEETFRGKQGQWQVRVEFKGATGRYSVKLVDF